MEGYDEDRPGSPVRMVLSDDDAAAPLMCPPYSEVVLCDGGVWPAARSHPRIHDIYSLLGECS